jgi:hypothetical protein
VGSTDLRVPNPAIAGTEYTSMVETQMAPPELADVEEAFDAIEKYAELLITTAYKGFRFKSRVAQAKHYGEVARVADWYMQVCAAAAEGAGTPRVPTEALAYLDRLLQAEYENTDNMVEMFRARQARIRNVQQWLRATGNDSRYGGQSECRAVVQIA